MERPGAVRALEGPQDGLASLALCFDSINTEVVALGRVQVGGPYQIVAVLVQVVVKDDATLVGCDDGLECSFMAS